MCIDIIPQTVQLFSYVFKLPQFPQRSRAGTKSTHSMFSSIPSVVETQYSEDGELWGLESSEDKIDTTLADFTELLRQTSDQGSILGTVTKNTPSDVSLPLRSRVNSSMEGKDTELNASITEHTSIENDSMNINHKDAASTEDDNQETSYDDANNDEGNHEGNDHEYIEDKTAFDSNDNNSNEPNSSKSL